MKLSSVKSIFRVVGTLLLLACVAPAQADRVKDLVNVLGVRDNQLVGYGLIVGLDGTGDQTSQAPFTVQSIRNMLSGFGIRVPDNVNPQLKNVAAVTVHATLPAFAKPGQAIDITVSSIGNAKSLRGGTLLMTPLLGADNQVYAMAQGSLLVGGLGVTGQDGSRVSINIPSAGRIPNGAIVERQSPTTLGTQSAIVLNLKKPDFTTAHRLAEEINKSFGAGSAQAKDPTSVLVTGPADPTKKVAYISLLENLEVSPAAGVAKVVINSRTGTVVIGGNVRVLPAAVTHGSLTVSIGESALVSQPEAFSRGGETVVVPDSNISIEQESNRMFLVEGSVTLEEIVTAINSVGAAPGDLVAILEALDQAGALRADLIVI